MITLTFLVCLSSGQCIQQAPPQVFMTHEQCGMMANAVIEDMQRKMAAGTVPPHTAIYKCIEWGTPS